MSNEEWRPVAGFEECYEVSSLGRVRTLPRSRTVRRYDRTTNTHIERVVTVRRVPKILKLKVNDHGYLEVCLRHQRRQRMAYVQRLVCEAFLGPPADADMQAAHRNSNRRDNRVANLMWATRITNAGHRKPFVNQSGGDRARWRRALMPEKTRAAVILNQQGMDRDTIARCLGLTMNTINRLLCANG